MITTIQISALYRQYPSTPALFEDCGISRLFDLCFTRPEVADFDGDAIVFTSMPADCPVRRVEIERIHGVSELGGMLAVVLENSIVFVAANGSIRVHLKDIEA